MAGAVIESLSNRKLCYILSMLFIALVVFFMLGAFCSPKPSSSMEFIMVKCKDKEGGRNPGRWFYIRPPHCDLIHDLEQYVPHFDDMRDIVFVAQMPHQRDGIALEYSAWFQFLLALLEIDIEYNPMEKAVLHFEVRLGYRTHSDGVEDWHELITANATRILECIPPEMVKSEGFMYNCDALDLFELGSNPYPFYLINLRIPVNQSLCHINPNGPNCAIGKIADLRIIAIHQNGGFTAIWLWMKTFVSPFVIIAIHWYWKRVSALNRKPYLVEQSIMALGIGLAILDVPIEWLSLWFKTPFMLLIGDIRQGLFYTILFSFWLIFTGEHLIDDNSRNNLKTYWRNLTSVFIASGCLLFYDMAERGMQINNPFFSIWSSELGSKFALIVVYIASLCLFCYFIFLVTKVWRVCVTIKRKRAAHLYRTSEIRRLKVEAVIYRFKFLMFFTLTCAAFTIISYVMKQYGEGQIHSSDPSESLLIHSTSAFFTGTFGMWNIYVLLLLAMYAPSHKNYHSSSVLFFKMILVSSVFAIFSIFFLGFITFKIFLHILVDEVDDSDFMATESAALTTFIKPASE
ncbi:unnamed protein product [Dracunculus medinensis]|uniref:Protein wntless-like protein n=1 Tax=Dracunculus medinensis TaxID=318479 RepID=A0A0N4UJI4_DRAME|nr:unnamed protein product [Dracunculus medinensis]